jgi:chromosomal replication initiator protein
LVLGKGIFVAFAGAFALILVRSELKSVQSIWEAALGELQLQVNKPNFDTWLKDTTGISYKEGVFVVGVPNVFIGEWLRSRLHSLIKRTLTSIISQPVEVQFTVRPLNPEIQPVASRQADGGTSTRLKEAPAFRLNSRYTFDNFVVGESNRLAYAAALEVCEDPGNRYNPLFIYGDTGSGKTHLLHAIGHTAKSRGLTTLIASAEQFTTQFVVALKNNKIDDFHRKFRATDFLLVDDIQFLSGKAQTQECLFHIFNDLYENNCQIVVTSDRPPRAISSITKKLRSRLEWGLIADLGIPDLETRLAILKVKSKQLNMALPPAEVLRFLAVQFQQNTRELEGALNRVATYSRLSGEKIDMKLTVESLADIIPKEIKHETGATPKVIITTVANFYGIDTEVLTGKRRDRTAVLARQITMYLLRERNHCSLAEIGRILGDRDHTTVLHGCEKIAAEIDLNPQLQDSINEIRQKLKPRRTRSTS